MMSAWIVLATVATDHAYSAFVIDHLPVLLTWDAREFASAAMLLLSPPGCFLPKVSQTGDPRMLLVAISFSVVLDWLGELQLY